MHSVHFLGVSVWVILRVWFCNPVNDGGVSAVAGCNVVIPTDPQMVSVCFSLKMPSVST